MASERFSAWARSTNAAHSSPRVASRATRHLGKMSRGSGDGSLLQPFIGCPPRNLGELNVTSAGGCQPSRVRRPGRHIRGLCGRPATAHRDAPRETRHCCRRLACRAQPTRRCRYTAPAGQAAILRPSRHTGADAPVLAAHHDRRCANILKNQLFCSRSFGMQFCVSRRDLRSKRPFSEPPRTRTENRLIKRKLVSEALPISGDEALRPPCGKNQLVLGCNQLSHVAGVID